MKNTLTLLPVCPVAWVQAWVAPLYFLTFVRVQQKPEVWEVEGPAFARAEFSRALYKLEHNDSLSAGLTKLLLAAISAVFVWGVVTITGVGQLGGSMLAMLVLVWRVVVWLWRLLVWQPPSWYPVQVRGGGTEQDRIGQDWNWMGWTGMDA
jgi:hypothetical protein